MPFQYIFVIVLIQQGIESKKLGSDRYGLRIYPQSAYKGEKFPEKYLSPDPVRPTEKDLIHYLKHLDLVIDYFNYTPNDTDTNTALGLDIMKASLLRTLLDYNGKIKEEEKLFIKQIINKARNYISHYRYNNDIKLYYEDELNYRVSDLFAYEEFQVFTLEKYRKNIMKRWIRSNVTINDHIEQIDDISLPKEKYVKFVVDMDLYYKISTSDKCLASIAKNAVPVRVEELHPCRPNPTCLKETVKLPTVAYALSHKLFYIMGQRYFRRCYLISEEVDSMHIDILCANMYRETVYLARRGYFFRDLFMEHIALCAGLGYEEFYRRHWFYKAISWLDDVGCMQENRNFDINNTKAYLDTIKDNPKKAKQYKLSKKVKEECQTHQMVLVLATLAHAVRHAVHFMHSVL